MVAFASGRHAKAICDNCGRTLPYVELRKQVVAQRPTGLLVCEDCFDIDHPQLMLGRFRIEDPISLKNARPDFPQSQGLARFDPVCGLNIDFRMGQAYASPSRVVTPDDEKVGFSISGVGLYININCGIVEAGAEG